MSLYLAAYDIGDNRRRRRVARLLRTYGHSVQYSVYEVWLEPDDLPEFRRLVGALLSVADAFDVYPIDRDPARPRFRWQRPPVSHDPVLEL